LNIKLLRKKAQENDKLIRLRKKYLGANLMLSYQTPLHIVRGFNQFLFDNYGRKYLDTVNNIAHVGHQNINVVKSAKKQLGILNTNTRYLHKEILDLSEKILRKFPKKLSKIYFVNSGSEANELAIRMSEIYTNSNNHIVSKGGYHGNTNYAINLSNYKYMSKGGRGKLKNIYEIPMPDIFRGKHRGKNTSKKYFSYVQNIVEKSKMKKNKISSMIIEPILSCGGQIELPKTFLKKCAKLFAKNNILLICDEVQTGFGRVGEKYWGFELYDVIPDIVTLGKPMGNGHPIGAVVCSNEVSEKFNNGMEFFSSFGGNPVSCKIASEVINEIESKDLQKNALTIGNYLKKGLHSLASKHPIIGDVRGKGLFLGFELVDEKLNPLEDKAIYLKSRMKDLGFLMSNDGIDHNVIKIKPPMIFNKKDADNLLFFLDLVLKEDFLRYD
jgi:4-aminobutyrate aminotransferase-like enzyme